MITDGRREALADRPYQSTAERSGDSQSDAWEGIVWCHERALEHRARDRGLRELLLGATPDALERAQLVRARLHPVRTSSSSAAELLASFDRTARPRTSASVTRIGSDGACPASTFAMTSTSTTSPRSA